MTDEELAAIDDRAIEARHAIARGAAAGRWTLEDSTRVSETVAEVRRLRGGLEAAVANSTVFMSRLLRNGDDSYAELGHERHRQAYTALHGELDGKANP